MKLYAAQEKLVQTALSGRRPFRYIIAADTGTGKTAMALSICRAVASHKILIVTMAIVRRPWLDEIAKWMPYDSQDVGVIEFGRERKMPSKPAEARRREAYLKRIQIVSYDLLEDIETGIWDTIIFDESHGLGNPTSAQSESAAALCASCPNAHILMLSATPIPTMPKQLWHSLHLLQPGKWGKPSATGDVSWEFARKYLTITSSEYGKGIGGFRPGGEETLRNALQGTMFTLTMKEIAPEMPPLLVSALRVKKLDAAFYRDWIKNLESDVTHAVIFTHLKKTAKQVADIAAKAGWPTIYMDGSVPAGKRNDILARCAASTSRRLLVATYDSLSVGVRLLWPRKVLICEFSSSPKTTAQTLGRFAAVGSAARPSVQVCIRPQDEGLADSLLQRVAGIRNVLGDGQGTEAIAQTFTTTQADVNAMMAGLFDDFIDAPEGWSDGNDDAE